MVYQKVVCVRRRNGSPEIVVESKAGKKYPVPLTEDQYQEIDPEALERAQDKFAKVMVPVFFKRLQGGHRETGIGFIPAELRKKTIKVMCALCGSEYDEDKVTEIDIEEGLQGKDIVTFECPECHETVKSMRFGR